MTSLNPYPLVGVLGKKRHGKDSFAAPLVEAGFERVAFADPLREAALRLDPIVGRPCIPGNLSPTHDVRLSDVIDLLGWEKAKDTVPEVRTILQRLGTDAIRTLDPDFWIRQALLSIDTRTTPVVITDVRFPNEAEAISSRGGTLVRVIRPSLPVSPDEHATEKALDGYPVDVVVETDTLSVLEDRAREVLLSYTL